MAQWARFLTEAAGLSLVVAGLLGAVVCSTTGPFIAMGLVIWMGNTEPQQVDPAFPWMIVVSLVVLVIVAKWAATRANAPGMRRVFRWVDTLASIAVAVLPLLSIADMVSRAGAE